MSRISEAFNPTAYATPGWKEPTTSRDAARKFGRFAANLRDQVLAEIAGAAGGLTADEVAARLNQSVLAIRPRVSELRAQNLIERSAERRKNASGMNAAVWKRKA